MSRKRGITIAAACLVVVGTLGALLKSAVDRVRETAARLDSV
jgi:hypothetical protein